MIEPGMAAGLLRDRLCLFFPSLPALLPKLRCLILLRRPCPAAPSETAEPFSPIRGLPLMEHLSLSRSVVFSAAARGFFGLGLTAESPFSLKADLPPPPPWRAKRRDFLGGLRPRPGRRTRLELFSWQLVETDGFFPSPLLESNFFFL